MVDVTGYGFSWGMFHWVKWTHHFARDGEPCGDSGGFVLGNGYVVGVELITCYSGTSSICTSTAPCQPRIAARGSTWETRTIRTGTPSWNRGTNWWST